ncbi:MAG TPA: UDP-N-acetyl-D-glucosamine dehydrogenase, partial [Candidatus Omnitrophota bacterium]|nr:UDP-N-acetyl-D-glucosamine dehydrogenase [Candidatus Omnitrophota bacterium]
SDPFIPSIEVGKRSLKTVSLSPAVLKKQDAIVILTDHSAFDYAAVAKFGRRVLDSRNILRRFAPKTNIFFL